MVDLIKEYKKIDINAGLYKRPPLHKDLFAITPRNDKYRIWVPNPDKIEMHTDKNHQQALLNIDDGAAEVTERVRINNYSDKKLSVRQGLNSTRLFIPNTKKKYKVIRNIPADYKNDIRMGVGELVMDITHVPTTKDKKITLLTGYDETALFVAALPKHVKEVAEAHEFLKPKEVTENSIRQGEFFLVPCAENLCKILDNKLKENMDVRVGVPWSGPMANNLVSRIYPLERNSNHHASLMIEYKKNKYVLGSVFDRRKTRHEPVILKEWHKVVRNKEIKVPESSITRTWD